MSFVVGRAGSVRFAEATYYRTKHLGPFFVFSGAFLGSRTALVVSVSSCSNIPLGLREYAPDGAVKDSLEIHLCQGRALDILVGLDIFRARQTSRVCNGRHPLLGQLLDRLPVITLVELGADEDDWDIGRVMRNLWEPLRHRSQIVSKCVLAWPRGLDKPWPGRCQKKAG